MALIGAPGRLAAGQDSGIAELAHRHVVPGKGLVFQITGFVAVYPLLLCEHESTRTDSDELFFECPLEEMDIASPFGIGPILSELPEWLLRVLVHQVRFSSSCE